MSYVARRWYIGEFPPGPNDQYESKSLGTWSSLSNVNTFFNTYKPDNGWNGLKLGNYVTIRDGTYNVDWEIAGFNCEHNQKNKDGTVVYDNGYGICMIPKTILFRNMRWNDIGTLTGGYKESYIHNELNTTVANNLKTKLGDHLINRNVLLSSECNGTEGTSSAYEWTTAYATLLSVGQVTGTFAKNKNKYDDGEANYKLPLFNYESLGQSDCWSRGISNYASSTYSHWIYLLTGTAGSNVSTYANNYKNVRPLIYLR